MPNEPIETVENENEELNENISETNSEIEQCLEQFRTAKLGEEVRGALIRAIELCYKDVISSIVEYGLKGDTGARGLSAYELAQTELHFEGSVTEWLASLKGEKGDKGEDGVVTIEDLQITIDNELDPNSQNPVKNSTLCTKFNEIDTALNKKMPSRIFSPSKAGQVPIITIHGGFIDSGKKIGSDNFQYLFL